MILLEGKAVVEFGWAKLEKRTSRQSTADLIVDPRMHEAAQKELIEW